MKREIDVDEADFDWYERNGPKVEQASGVDARMRGMLPAGLPRKTVVLVAFLIPMVVVSTFLFAGGATASTDFTAADVSATSHNGQLKTLTMAPDGTITFSGLEQKASSATVTVEVQEPDGKTWTEVGSKEVTFSSTYASTEDYSFQNPEDEIDILAKTDWDKEDWDADDGDSDSKTISIRVSVTLVGVGPNSGDVTATDETSFKVTLTNKAANGGIGGNGNTNGSGNADNTGSGV